MSGEHRGLRCGTTTRVESSGAATVEIGDEVSVGGRSALWSSQFVKSGMSRAVTDRRPTLHSVSDRVGPVSLSGDGTGSGHTPALHGRPSVVVREEVVRRAGVSRCEDPLRP